MYVILVHSDPENSASSVDPEEKVQPEISAPSRDSPHDSGCYESNENLENGNNNLARLWLSSRATYFLCGLPVSACSRVKQNKLTCLNSVCNKHTLAIHLATISALSLAQFDFFCSEGQPLSFSQPSVRLSLLHSVYPLTWPSCFLSKTQRTCTFHLILFIMYKEVVALHLFCLLCFDHGQQWFSV